MECRGRRSSIYFCSTWNEHPILYETILILGIFFTWNLTGDEVDNTIENTPPLDRERGVEVGEW